MFFLLAVSLASIGPGSIHRGARRADGHDHRRRAGIPPFLMAIMGGNGANAGSLSPFAPTGLIVTGLMARIGHERVRNRGRSSKPTGPCRGGFRRLLPVRWIVAIIFEAHRPPGRLRRPGAGRSDRFLRVSPVAHAGRDRTPSSVLPRPPRCQRRHGRVLRGNRAGALPVQRRREAIKRMPWNVIVMVCGMTVLIALLRKPEGIDLFVTLLVKLSTRWTQSLQSWRSSPAGISVYSSTSGVVLPAFLPMVPSLAAASWRGRRAGNRLVNGGRIASCRCVTAFHDWGAVHRVGHRRMTAGASSINCWHGGCRWRWSAPASATCCLGDEQGAVLSAGFPAPGARTVLGARRPVPGSQLGSQFGVRYACRHEWIREVVGAHAGGARCALQDHHRRANG